MTRRVKPAGRIIGRKPTVVPLEFPVDPDVTRVLTQFSERAATGTVSGIAVATVNRDGSTSSAYVVGSNIFTLMGVVRNIQRRIEDEAR